MPLIGKSCARRRLIGTQWRDPSRTGVRRFSLDALRRQQAVPCSRPICPCERMNGSRWPPRPHHRTVPNGNPPRQNGCRLVRSCIFGSGTHVVVGGCGACGRRSARWSTRSVVHGKPAGARSASSTNPQPDAALLSVRIPGTCFNKQGAMREHIGTIRTSIQRQGSGAVVAATERGAGDRLARRWHRRGHAGSLAQ